MVSRLVNHDLCDSNEEYVVILLVASNKITDTAPAKNSSLLTLMAVLTSKPPMAYLDLRFATSRCCQKDLSGVGVCLCEVGGTRLKYRFIEDRS